MRRRLSQTEIYNPLGGPVPLDAEQQITDPELREALLNLNNPTTTAAIQNLQNTTRPDVPMSYVPIEETNFNMTGLGPEVKPEVKYEPGTNVINQRFTNLGGGIRKRSGGGRGNKNAVSPKMIRWFYRHRVKRPVSQTQRDRMRELGKKWGPVLKEAREVARRAGRGRITKADYAAARRTLGM